MEKLTKKELEWLNEAAEYVASFYKGRERRCKSDVEKCLAALRAEQFAGISERLKRAIQRGDKRIEIK